MHIDSVRKSQSKVCSNDWLLAVTYSACQLSRKGQPVDPRELHGKFHEAGVQEDAQEFMSALLDSLPGCCFPFPVSRFPEKNRKRETGNLGIRKRERGNEKLGKGRETGNGKQETVNMERQMGNKADTSQRGCLRELRRRTSALTRQGA